MNTFDLTLDLSKRGPFLSVPIRQGDKSGTTIRATITDHGVAVSTSGLTSRFVMRLPDNEHYYRETATLSGSTATVTIDEAQAASAAGRTDVAYFQLLQGTDVIASTESFTVIVLPDALADATVPDSYDTEIQKAIDEANEAAEAADSANKAATSANNAASSANTAASKANTAAGSANSAASSATTATTAANSAADAAKTATTAANKAADRANTAAGSAESIVSGAVATPQKTGVVYIADTDGTTAGTQYNTACSMAFYNTAASAMGELMDAELNGMRDTVAPTEDTGAASRDYAVGEFFYNANRNLCRVTQAVSQGASLVSGTNYTTVSGGVQQYIGTPTYVYATAPSEETVKAARATPCFVYAVDTASFYYVS